MIELDELLIGSPTWDQVVEFFREGEFFREHFAVDAIKRWLLTEDQRRRLFEAGISIEDMLNGRVEGAGRQAVEEAIYAEWNVKLGFRHFGG